MSGTAAPIAPVKIDPADHIDWAAAIAHGVSERCGIWARSGYREDLYAIAYLTLCQAATRFDPALVPAGGDVAGAFRGYAHQSIQTACRREARRVTNGGTYRTRRERSLEPITVAHMSGLGGPIQDQPFDVIDYHGAGVMITAPTCDSPRAARFDADRDGAPDLDPAEPTWTVSDTTPEPADLPFHLRPRTKPMRLFYESLQLWYDHTRQQLHDHARACFRPGMSEEQMVAAAWKYPLKPLDYPGLAEGLHGTRLVPTEGRGGRRLVKVVMTVTGDPTLLLYKPGRTAVTCPDGEIDPDARTLTVTIPEPRDSRPIDAVRNAVALGVRKVVEELKLLWQPVGIVLEELRRLDAEAKQRAAAAATSRDRLAHLGYPVAAE